MLSFLCTSISSLATFEQMAVSEKTSDMSAEDAKDTQLSASKMQSELPSMMTGLKSTQNESVDGDDEATLRTRIGSRLSIRVVSSPCPNMGLPGSETSTYSLFFPRPSQVNLGKENINDAPSTQCIDESDNLETQGPMIPGVVYDPVGTLDNISAPGTEVAKNSTMSTTLIHQDSYAALDQSINEADPMDEAIDDALDLVEAALLDMSTFAIGDRELPNLSPVLPSEVNDDVISNFTTYASATNLALQHPERASAILKQPLVAGKTVVESASPHMASTNVTPGLIHAPDAPNWALAADAPIDEKPQHQKARSRSNSRGNWMPRGRARRGYKPVHDHQRSRDGHRGFHRAQKNQLDQAEASGRPHLQLHLAQNNIAVAALENALFQDISRKRHSQQSIIGVGEVSAAMKFARLCNADLKSVFSLINSTHQNELRMHRQTPDASQPPFVPDKLYELRTSDWKNAPSTPPISPRWGRGGGHGRTTTRFPNSKWVGSPSVTATPPSIRNPVTDHSSITHRHSKTLTNDGSSALGISSFIGTTVAQQKTELAIQPASQAQDDTKIAPDCSESDIGLLNHVVSQRLHQPPVFAA